MLSPFILGYHSFDATAQQVIIGVIVTLVGGVRMALPAIHWPSWVNVILSAELILISLNIAGASQIIHWNTTVVGLVLLGLSLRSASRQQLFTAPRTTVR